MIIRDMVIMFKVITSLLIITAHITFCTIPIVTNK
jgi:hypothetical protein